MPGIVYLGKIKQLQIADKQEKFCSKLENETDFANSTSKKYNINSCNFWAQLSQNNEAILIYFTV